MIPDALYVDEETVDELVLLRRLVAAHRRLREIESRPMDGDQQDLIVGAHRQIRRILDSYERNISMDRAKYDEAIGVVVGRFQIPELHDGHHFLLQTVKNRHANVGVAIGVSATVSDKNPLPYNLRATMIQQDYPDILTFPIHDHESDHEWSLNLDREIVKHFPIGKVRLYGSRDSFAKVYTGALPVSQIDPTESWSGTQVREKVGEHPMNDAAFRRGIIFATQHTKVDTVVR